MVKFVDGLASVAGECTPAPAAGAYSVLVDARDWRSGFISRADVADFLVTQIGDASLIHKTPVLTR